MLLSIANFMSLKFKYERRHEICTTELEHETCFCHLRINECKHRSMSKVFLVDIEGTTTNISFVKDVLFPYARDNCKSFLSQHFDEPEIKSIVDELCELSITDGEPIERSSDKEAFIISIVKNVHRQIREDRKTKELKNLQGKIWKVAFESGAIKGLFIHFSRLNNAILFFRTYLRRCSKKLQEMERARLQDLHLLIGLC